MDTLFIWLIAGAAIGLLGVFLVASERELKRKRLELEELKQKLSDAPPPSHSSTSSYDFSQADGASAELMARNKELLEEVSSLSAKLEGNESRLEQLETLRAHLNSKESEITELRWECERLQSELTTLKIPSGSNDAPADEAMQNSQVNGEIAALREQLAASQARVRDLESTQIQPIDQASGEQAFEELQRSFEVSTVQLQNALAAEQEKQKALEATQHQLEEMRQRHHELEEANRQLREESFQHQRKLTNQNQLQVERWVILRQRFEALRLQQVEVSERARSIQEEIVSMSQLLDGVPESAPANDSDFDGHNSLEFKRTAFADAAATEIVEPISFGGAASELDPVRTDGSVKTNGISAETPHDHATSPVAAIAAADQNASELSPSGSKKKRRFGIFPAAIGVLVVGGALAAGVLGRDSEKRSAALQAEYDAELTPSGLSKAASMTSQPTPMELGHKAGRPVEEVLRAAPAMPQESPAASRTSKLSDKETTTAVASYRKPATTAWQSYEIIQPTRVFSAPRADSQLIANIEPGTQVNVVGSQDGWLEIRSKHGRPPGFIPKNAAIRIGPN